MQRRVARRLRLQGRPGEEVNPVIRAYTVSERDKRLALAREVERAAADAQQLADELQAIADDLRENA